MKTRDIDVRRELHNVLSREFLIDDDTVMIDELGLCQGDARIDIVIVNGLLHGYEIKSDSDTLERLPRQVDIYNRVLDTVTIVTGKNHIDKAVEIIPEWWGIVLAEKKRSDIIDLRAIRAPKANPQVDPYSLVQLLWKNEVIELLTIYGLEKGYLSKPRRILWKKAAENVPLYELQRYVRQQLKFRENWRVAQQQI